MAFGIIMGVGVVDTWAASDFSVRPVLPDQPVLPSSAQLQRRPELPLKNQTSEPVRPTEPDGPSPERVEPAGFTILEFVVEGSALLSREKIEAVLSKFKGPGKTIKDIERARVELEMAFKDVQPHCALLNRLFRHGDEDRRIP